ncbi:rhodanese-like domain-containing protein, partial [Pandoraea pneumonica]
MQLLDPPDAHAFLERTPAALFVDCRSEMEHLFVGHPAGAHHVSWNDGPHWEVNPEFVPTVRKLTG